MEETRLLTIDGSTQKSGVALFINGKYNKHVLLDFSKDKNMDSRFEEMSKSLWDNLSNNNPDVVYMEEVYSARDPRTSKFLSRLQGVVYSWCMNNNCEFNTITPSSWRKQLEFHQGKGVKRIQLKEQSIKYVLEHYDLKVNDDEADAICIGDAVIKKYS